MGRVCRSLWRTSLPISGLCSRSMQANYCTTIKYLIQMLLPNSVCALSKCALQWLWGAFTHQIFSTLLILCPKEWHWRWLAETRAGLMITLGSPWEEKASRLTTKTKLITNKRRKTQNALKRVLSRPRSRKLTLLSKTKVKAKATISLNKWDYKRNQLLWEHRKVRQKPRMKSSLI